MSRGAICRGGAALGLCLSLGAAGVACPAKDLRIDITATGMTAFALACRDLAPECSRIKLQGACTRDPLCAWENGECVLDGRCGAGDGPTFDALNPKAIQVLLVGANPITLHEKSRCVPILPPPDRGCDELSGKARAACSAEAMNQAIDNAMRSGLTYDGFEDRADAFPVIAIYDLPALPEACAEGLDKVACARPNLPCPPEDLVGCAGLALPINTSTYDITCTSCRGGPRFSVGYDTGPCPPVGGECFFKTCAAAVGKVKSGG